MTVKKKVYRSKTHVSLLVISMKYFFNQHNHGSKKYIYILVHAFWMHIVYLTAKPSKHISV